MQIRGSVTLLVLGAWLAHASFADDTAAPSKSDDAVRAAAEAYSRAKAQRREALAAARAQTQARLDAALQKANAAVQAKTYLDPFRERLDLEIHYIERTCGLTGDQAATMTKQGGEIADRAQADLAKALAAQTGQPRQAVVIVNGNALAVPAGINGEYLTDPAQAARHELQRLVVPLLSVEAQAKLDEAHRQTNERALHTARLAVLATLDEALSLNGAQRAKIAELLDAVWDLPLAVSTNPYLGDPAVLQQAATLLHDVRLVLPDAELTSLLRPAQLAHWKALGALVSQVHANQPRRLLNVPGGPAAVGWLQAAPAMRAAARVQGRIQVAVREQAQPFAGQKIGVQQGRAVGNVALPAMETLLDLVVDDVATTSELSADQRTKLLLAGQLDLKRLARLSGDVVEGAAVNDAAGLAGHVRVIERRIDGKAAQVVRVDLPLGRFGQGMRGILLDPSSALQKMLTGRLTAAQIERLAAADRERRALRDEATLAAVVQAIDECLLLSAEQHRQLSELFRQQLASRPSDRSTTKRPVVAAEQLARISARDLEPIFDDVQRPHAAKVWQELWATVPLVGEPVIEK